MKKAAIIFLIMSILISVSGCGIEDNVIPVINENQSAINNTGKENSLENLNTNDDETWAIYWYLCGSDLESKYGAATTDLEEMLMTSLPENVTVVVETGGAEAWQNDVNPNYIQRFVYNHEGFNLIEESPLANMGDADTLSDFLKFCIDNYPADRQMVLFWNHGGGSVSGICFDELYDGDSLSLDEVYQAFSDVCTLSEENPPFELIGFDACLMATIDTAFMLKDISRYMVASEEVEPGNGWEYELWLNSLAENPKTDGAMLGKIICDSYAEGCRQEETDAEITLSVIDLSKINALNEAYNQLGIEALSIASGDSAFFSKFSRCAISAENYGGNTKNEGYTNMVDLRNLVKNAENLLPENSGIVLDALNDCVVYKINGPYRKQSGGLSCFYSYNGDTENFEEYSKISANEPFTRLYEYRLSGKLDEAAAALISDDITITNFDKFDVQTLEDVPVTVNEDGYAVLELDIDTADMLSDVGFTLGYFDTEEDIFILLGSDNDIYCDWESGTFTDNFNSLWGAIDNHLVYLELSYSDSEYILYNVPILLNGKECCLSVSYDYLSEEYSILGAREAIDENGMSDKNLTSLKTGDEITTLFYCSTLSEENDFELIPIETFAVKENTYFNFTDLGDGTFVFMFDMYDFDGDYASSEVVFVTVEDGYIIFEE